MTHLVVVDVRLNFQGVEIECGMKGYSKVDVIMV